jgi:hypothetical protein
MDPSPETIPFSSSPVLVAVGAVASDSGVVGSPNEQGGAKAVRPCAVVLGAGIPGARHDSTSHPLLFSVLSLFTTFCKIHV